MSIRKNLGVTLSLAGLVAFMGLGAQAGEITISSDKLEIKGDLRLRHQTTEETSSTNPTNRDRQRYRLRVGMDYTVNSMLKVKTRIASGNGEQTSTNQTFDNLASQKQLWVDQAYLELKPLPGDRSDLLKVMGGRMANPFWGTYTSDTVWDTDLNPEGLAQQVKTSLFGAGRFFLNAQQWVVNEKKSSTETIKLSNGRPQYVFSEQIGVILPTPMDSRVTLAGALHDWVNETDRAMIASPGKFEGTNTNSSGRLLNDFRVMQLDAEWHTSILDIPVDIQGTYLQNTAHKDPADITTGFITDANGAKVTDKQDMGYQLGLQVGKASNPNSWELAYYRKYLEADATVASASDSDFPGTNREGNIYWLAYAPWKNQQFKVKVLQTSIIEGKEKDIDTLQLDWQVKF